MRHLTPRLARRLAAPCLLAILVALALGCASQGEGEKGGGAANLPNRGLAGYVFERDEDDALVTLALGEEGEQVRHPSALVVDGRVVLYAEVSDGKPDGATRIVRAESSDGVAFGPPREVVGSDVVEGGLRGASVARRPDGGYRMVGGSADGLSLFALESDDGLVFDTAATVLLEAEGFEEASAIANPSLLFDVEGGREYLFYEARSGDMRPVYTLRRASRPIGSDAPFARDGVILTTRTGCLANDGETEATCWDQGVVSSPHVVLSRDVLGTRIWRLTYAGGPLTVPNAVGFALSFDGETWSHYPYNPAIGTTSIVAVEPSNVRLGESYLMYVGLVKGRARDIAVAVSNRGAPSEEF